MTSFIAIFVTIFLAELGDKTQLATVLFASNSDANRWVVLAASAGALVSSSAIAVLVGAGMETYLSRLPLKLIAGVGFILIGVLMAASHFRAA